MGKEIFEALKLLEKEKGISMDFMIEKIQKAIVTACKNNYDGNEDVQVIINPEKSVFEASLLKTVVDEVLVPGKEISLKDALKIKKGSKIDDQIAVKINTKDFGRIAAGIARNIIRQGIKDGEKYQITKEFQDRQDSLTTALVEKVDDKTDAITLRIGKAETTLTKNEQIGNENVEEGDFIKIYISEVKSTERGPKIIISRSHPNFVRKLFEKEIPEIAQNIVCIKSISREAGSRSKVALYSLDKNVDPIGACIGSGKDRINIILNEIKGEKIDLIKYEEDIEKFISNSLSPANVISVTLDEENPQSCVAVVPANQLSLAIGNRGQNVRLAARLTGYKIDIRAQE